MGKKASKPEQNRSIGYDGEITQCQCGATIRLKLVGRHLKPFNEQPPFRPHECPDKKKPLPPHWGPRIKLQYQAQVRSNPYGKRG